MNSDSLHPRCLSPLRIQASRTILPTVIFFSVLFFANSAYGQSVPGFQAPDKPKVKDDTPIAVKAARGEVPFSKIYGHLKLDSTKTKRLGQLSRSEKNKKNRHKILRIGVVRTLPTPLEPLSEARFIRSLKDTFVLPVSLPKGPLRYGYSSKTCRCPRAQGFCLLAN